MNNKILIFAAHPDDEILGIGGTIARHIDENDDVKIVIMAEGITSRDNIRDINLRQKELEELRQNTYSANAILGVTKENIFFENFPDNRMDSIDQIEINKKVEFYIEKFQPNIVYTHHIRDLNIDHRRTHEAVLTACRPIPGQCVQKILCFETVSSTEWSGYGFRQFHPNYFVNIEKYLEKKLKALAFYKSEMKNYPYARSIQNVENLARFRGASVGIDSVEGFVLVREII